MQRHTGVEGVVGGENETARVVLEELLQAAELLLELLGEVGRGGDLSQHLAHLADRLDLLLLQDLSAEHQQSCVGHHGLQHEVAVQDVVYEAVQLHLQQPGIRQSKPSTQRTNINNTI